MKRLEGINLDTVKEVYNGPEGDLWELVMGEQIHIGGFVSSMALAERAGIGEGMHGVDLCACNGAGMRFLVRFFHNHGLLSVKDRPQWKTVVGGSSDYVRRMQEDWTNVEIRLNARLGGLRRINGIQLRFEDGQVSNPH